MADFVHYVQRRVVIRLRSQSPRGPWFKHHELTEHGLTAPRYHITRARGGAATRVRAGDTIWLFSELRAPWGEKLPPALDAKLIVAKVCPRDERLGTHKFVAGKGSTWFPLYDARKTIAALRTRDDRKLVSKPGQPIGFALQSMRQLKTGEPLQALERTIAGSEYEFISYRLSDGTRKAFEAACSLVKRGIPVWWDRWSLPRGLAERRESLRDAALDKLIRERIRNSKVVWGISTKKYAAETSYSFKEKKAAMKANKFKNWPSANGRRGRGPP